MKIKDLVFKEIKKSDYTFMLAVGIARNYSIEENKATGRFNCDFNHFDSFQKAVDYCNRLNLDTYLMKIKELEEIKSRWEVK